MTSHNLLESLDNETFTSTLQLQLVDFRSKGGDEEERAIAIELEGTDLGTERVI